MTKPVLIDMFSQQANNLIAVQESDQAKRAEDICWCLTKIDHNKELEQLLYGHFNLPVDSERSCLLDDDVQLDFLGRKSRKIKPFVRVRHITSKNDKTWKEPSHVGKVTDVRATLRKLQEDPTATLEKKEDSWLIRAYQDYKLVVILSENTETPMHNARLDLLGI